jgi:DNA-binding PadR family transcriptional regulator
MYKMLLVLGLLRARSLHGYELHRIVRSYGDLYPDLKKANLYYLLDRLARSGYLEVQVEPAARGVRGERFTYTITEKGCAYFEELLRGVLRSYEPIRTGIDVAVVLLEHLPLGEAIRLLDERYSAIAYRRELVAGELGDVAGRSLLEFIASDHLLMLIDAELAWIDRSLQQLREAESNVELVPKGSMPLSTDKCLAQEKQDKTRQREEKASVPDV